MLVLLGTASSHLTTWSMCSGGLPSMFVLVLSMSGLYPIHCWYRLALSCSISFEKLGLGLGVGSIGSMTLIVVRILVCC